MGALRLNEIQKTVLNWTKNYLIYNIVWSASITRMTEASEGAVVKNTDSMLIGDTRDWIVIPI